MHPAGSAEVLPGVLFVRGYRRLPTDRREVGKCRLALMTCILLFLCEYQSYSIIFVVLYS